MSTPCSQCPINENMIPRFFSLIFARLLLLSRYCCHSKHICSERFVFHFWLLFLVTKNTFLSDHTCTHSSHNCYDSHTDQNEHIQILFFFFENEKLIKLLRNWTLTFETMFNLVYVFQSQHTVTADESMGIHQNIILRCSRLEIARDNTGKPN